MNLTWKWKHLIFQSNTISSNVCLPAAANHSSSYSFVCAILDPHRHRAFLFCIYEDLMPHLLFSKLWNSSLCRSIFISVSRAGCPRLERLRLFIHPQTPFNFSSLVLRCPPFPSPLCQISPFLSVLMDYGLRLTVGHYSGSKHNFRPFILAWICSLLPPPSCSISEKAGLVFPSMHFPSPHSLLSLINSSC